MLYFIYLWYERTYVLLYGTVISLRCNFTVCVLNACRKSTFNMIAISGRTAHTACHIIREREAAGWILFALLWKHSCSTCEMSEVSCCVVSTSERHQRIRCHACRLRWHTLDNLWHKVGATKKHSLCGHGALAAGTVASQQEGRGFVSCVEPAWMFAWIYSKDQQARRIGGSKLANGVNLSQSVCLWTLWQLLPGIPTFYAGIQSSPLWHRKWALVWRQ